MWRSARPSYRSGGWHSCGFIDSFNQPPLNTDRHENGSARVFRDLDAAGTSHDPAAPFKHSPGAHWNALAEELVDTRVLVRSEARACAQLPVRTRASNATSLTEISALVPAIRTRW